MAFEIFYHHPLADSTLYSILNKVFKHPVGKIVPVLKELAKNNRILNDSQIYSFTNGSISIKFRETNINSRANPLHPTLQKQFDEIKDEIITLNKLADQLRHIIALCSTESGYAVFQDMHIVFKEVYLEYYTPIELTNEAVASLMLVNNQNLIDSINFQIEFYQLTA